MSPKTKRKAASEVPLNSRCRTPRTRRSQREVLLELLRAAARRSAWLSLNEMARETNFPHASISAQLRHLRKPKHGSWKIERQRRDWVALQLVWEYRLAGKTRRVRR